MRAVHLVRPVQLLEERLQRLQFPVELVGAGARTDRLHGGIGGRGRFRGRYRGGRGDRCTGGRLARRYPLFLIKRFFQRLINTGLHQIQVADEHREEGLQDEMMKAASAQVLCGKSLRRGEKWQI